VEGRLSYDDSDLAGRCGKRVASDYVTVSAWDDLLGTVLLSEFPLAPGSQQCGTISRAQTATDIASQASLFSLTREVAAIYGGMPPQDESHLRAILYRLEDQYHLSEFPSVGVDPTDAQRAAYKRQARYTEYRAEAVGPMSCTQAPLLFEKYIANAGPGPNLRQTDAWLADNLPTSYFALTVLSNVSQQMTFDVDDCTLGVDITGKETVLDHPLDLPQKPLYVVSVEAASLDARGQKVYFGQYGHGFVHFENVRPSSIKVDTQDASATSLPNSLGYTTFDVAFDDQDKATRVGHAFTRLAQLCGAHDDPF
jgi:hypothetical protein